jgi:hypothetical protein
MTGCADRRPHIIRGTSSIPIADPPLPAIRTTEVPFRRDLASARRDVKTTIFRLLYYPATTWHKRFNKCTYDDQVVERW